MSEESNDVTKALAAFGAPSIRYHSFGQAQGRPSSLTLPRRADPAFPPVPAAPVGAPIIQQAEPVAAPEAPVSRAVSPPASMAPRSSPLFPSAPAPTMAPPPRPLAEWAAPVSTVPARPIAPPPVPVMQTVAVPEPSYTAVTPQPVLPTPPPRPAPAQPAPALMAAAPPAHAPAVYTPAPTPTASPVSRQAMLSRASSLPEIFEFLAAS